MKRIVLTNEQFEYLYQLANAPIDKRSRDLRNLLSSIANEDSSYGTGYNTIMDKLKKIVHDDTLFNEITDLRKKRRKENIETTL